MNFFGVGGAELVLILIIMMVVAGPKRMIRWMYILGVYAGKVRDMWKEVAAVLQEEVDAAGIDFKVPEQIPTKQNIVSSVNKFAQEAVKPVQQPLEDLQNEVKGIQNEVTNEVKAAQDESKEALKVDLKQKEQPVSVANNLSKAEPVTETASQNGSAHKTPESPPDDSNFGTWSQSGT